jgi:TPR repeat protein
MKWIQLAAYNDDSKAMVMMGQFFHLGRGVKINLVEALAWYNLAKQRTNEIIQPMANLLRELNTLEIRQAQERASEINKTIKATPYLD